MCWLQWHRKTPSFHWTQSLTLNPKGEIVVPIDLEAVRLERAMWHATDELRWFCQAVNDVPVLQQLYERVTGERSWRDVPVCFGETILPPYQP